MVAEASVNGSLKGTSINRLACLFRHWTWADEAMARFEQELANGWEYEEDPRADHLFGAYYHWCALLCGFSEAALEHGLLPESQLDALRPDLETSLPVLRACRQLLVVIPTSREEHPRIVDLLRDVETLGRLRRVHYAFGEALREVSRARRAGPMSGDLWCWCRLDLDSLMNDRLGHRPRLGYVSSTVQSPSAARASRLESFRSARWRGS